MLAIELDSPLRVAIESVPDLGTPSVAEWIINIATLIIAGGGFILSIYVFKQQRADSRAQTDSARRLDLMKTLILDQNIPDFYRVFQSLRNSTDALLSPGCDRSKVEAKIQSLLRELNEQILSLFMVIDSALYMALIDESDVCRDNLVDSLGNPNIDLSVEGLYIQHVLSHLNRAKREMLRRIYNYDGHS
ncbi:MAG: hypothetical protein K2J78_06955 [Muribaculaceae bacterium]|nr:hypothetical protein [Muribaculaceae bacterium]